MSSPFQGGPEKRLGPDQLHSGSVNSIMAIQLHGLNSIPTKAKTGATTGTTLRAPLTQESDQEKRERERSKSDLQKGKERKGKERKREGREMTKPLTTCFTLLSVVLLLLIFASRECSAGEEVVVKMSCSGRGGKCLSVDEEMEGEMEMDSEANRRLLWATKRRYISYESLRGDVVPCSRPGISYYNCRALPRSNFYSRGCEIITDCARDP